MTRRRGKIRVEVLNYAVDPFSEMVRNVRSGLLSIPKDLSPWPKYLYDREGSELFEETTRRST